MNCKLIMATKISDMLMEQKFKYLDSKPLSYFMVNSNDFDWYIRYKLEII